MDSENNEIGEENTKTVETETVSKESEKAPKAEAEKKASAKDFSDIDVNLADFLDEDFFEESESEDESESESVSDDAKVAKGKADEAEQSGDKADESGDDADESSDDADESSDDADESADESEEEEEDGNAHLSKKTFKQLGLKKDLMASVLARGYERPTPVQAAAFGPGSKGKDLVVRSKTGTGKTAAFLMPALNRLKGGSRQTKVLVLTPTRELAIQIAEEAELLTSKMDLDVLAVYGGVSIKAQADALLRGVEVVAGTPGRILDHIRRKNLDLSNVQTAILDEADEMLSMGFYEDVTSILEQCNKKQTQFFLFSATVDASIAGIINRYMENPKEIMLSTDIRTVDGINNILYRCSESYPKARSLLYVLYKEEPTSALIFCNTRADTAFIAKYLTNQGFDAEPISSDLSQKERETVMGRIKRGEISFLVATDVASRGIDITNLSHVINYDLPQDPNIYLHRVGRTGRAGKVGTALNLYSGRDLNIQNALEKGLEIPFEYKELPTPEEAAKLFMDRRLVELRKVKDSVAYESYLPLAKSMVEDLEPGERDRLIATALRMFFTSLRVKGKASEQRDTTSDGESEEDNGYGRRESRRQDRDRSSRGRSSDNRRGGRSDGRRSGRRDESSSSRDRDRGRSEGGRRGRSRDEESSEGSRSRKSSDDRRSRSDKGRGSDDRRRSSKSDRKPERSNAGRSGSSSNEKSTRPPKKAAPKKAAPKKVQPKKQSSGDIDLSDWLDDGASDSKGGDSGGRRGGNRRRGRGGRRSGGGNE